ncbi:MYND-type domain-containing protein [Favolaschia claudopus]|uniref:MYND-type domain-containing protein n=1 Tax=Favolaschia claudopus TaxID=2862362 RepID=A0AAV9ZZV6_9AGAR
MPTQKPSKDRHKTDGTGPRDYEKKGATRFCSMDNCFNFKNLKECAQCKTVCYCSRECQRKHWKVHKPVCAYNTEQYALADGEEPLLQRNLRHWIARFHTSLLVACIRALNVRSNWDRLDNYGLVIRLEPCPHANVEIFVLVEHLGVLEQLRDQVLPMHNEARKRLHQPSGGRSDYSFVITIASNTGDNVLEGEHEPTFRFTPMDVHRDLVELLPAEFLGMDWRREFDFQVEEDHPLKSVVPSS